MLLIRALKIMVLKTHEHISKGFDAQTGYEFKQLLDKYSKELSETFE